MFFKDGKPQSTVTDTHIRGFFGRYRFLSNFEVAPCTVDGYTYMSSEHAYMAQKTHEVYYKEELANNITLCSEARKFGQTIPLREDWNEARYESMLKVLQAKFFQNPRLAAELLDTGDKILEETNYWKDTYWGVCNGIGESNLGKALMEVRTMLKESTKE